MAPPPLTNSLENVETCKETASVIRFQKFVYGDESCQENVKSQAKDQYKGAHTQSAVSQKRKRESV